MIEESNSLHKKIDDLGYRDMPEDAYREWLEAINREKESIKEHNAKYDKILLQTID